MPPSPGWPYAASESIVSGPGYTFQASACFSVGSTSLPSQLPRTLAPAEPPEWIPPSQVPPRASLQARLTLTLHASSLPEADPWLQGWVHHPPCPQSLIAGVCPWATPPPPSSDQQGYTTYLNKTLTGTEGPVPLHKVLSIQTARRGKML